MSLYVLDTDTLTLYRAGHSQVCQHVLNHAPDELAVTVISVEEQISGWYRLLRRARRRDQLARAYEKLARTVQFYAERRMLSFSESAIERFERLKASKLGVGSMDLRIAAITLEHGGTLVTRNMRDFGRVPGLAIQDWTQ